MTTKEKEIFTTEEAAEMMGCSPSTIEDHARNRVLPGLRLVHQHLGHNALFQQPIHLRLERLSLCHGVEGVKKWLGQHLVLDSELKFAPAWLNACHGA